MFEAYGKRTCLSYLTTLLCLCQQLQTLTAHHYLIIFLLLLIFNAIFFIRN